MQTGRGDLTNRVSKKIQVLQQKRDPTNFKALRTQIHASAFNLKKVICGQGVLSLEDTKTNMFANNSTIPIFN